MKDEMNEQTGTKDTLAGKAEQMPDAQAVRDMEARIDSLIAAPNCKTPPPARKKRQRELMPGEQTPEEKRRDMIYVILVFIGFILFYELAKYLFGDPRHFFE